MSKCVIMPNFLAIGRKVAEIMAIFEFFKMAAAAILDFNNLKYLTVTVKNVKLHHFAKFRQNRSNRGRNMVIFYFLKDGSRCHLGFSKFYIFNGRTRQECRPASPCQISWRSLKFLIFKGRNVQEGRTASLCQMS